MLQRGEKLAFRIQLDREKCIGCGACTAQCPDNWEMEESDEFKARPKKTMLNDIGSNKDAEEICPVRAIKITET